MHIGIRVRKARDDLGISREELVQQMPVSLRMDRNTLWHIEAGRTKNPRADQLLALAHVLHVSVDYLLGLTDDPTPAVRRGGRTGKKETTPHG
jgi:transcriptional regulator with XRE-family HTH domain